MQKKGMVINMGRKSKNNSDEAQKKKQSCKFRERLVVKNPKAGFIKLFIVLGVLLVTAGVVLALNFSGRISEACNQIDAMRAEEKQAEAQAIEQADTVVTDAETKKLAEDEVNDDDDDNSDNFKNSKKKDSRKGRTVTTREKTYERQEKTNYKSKFVELMALTTADYVMLGIILGSLLIWGIIYWLYMIAYVAARANNYGLRGYLFGVIALFFNVAALVILIVYVRLNIKCPGCGKLHLIRRNYCTVCGERLRRDCPECGKSLRTGQKYCANCGHITDEPAASAETV